MMKFHIHLCSILFHFNGLLMIYIFIDHFLDVVYLMVTWYAPATYIFHFGSLSWTIYNLGLNAFFLQNSEEHYRSILRLVKEQTQSESEWNDASSKVKYISSRIDLLDVIIKAENFDFVTELKKLAAEHIDAE